MGKGLEIPLIVVAILAVGIADVFTKKIAAGASGFGNALRHPLMLAVLALYIVQILVFAYVFVKKAELGIVGIIQTALYGIVVVGSGILFFKEKITLVQGIGIGLAIAGIVLMNL